MGIGGKRAVRTEEGGRWEPEMRKGWECRAGRAIRMVGGF